MKNMNCEYVRLAAGQTTPPDLSPFIPYVSPDIFCHAILLSSLQEHENLQKCLSQNRFRAKRTEFNPLHSVALSCTQLH